MGAEEDNEQRDGYKHTRSRSLQWLSHQNFEWDELRENIRVTAKFFVILRSCVQGQHKQRENLANVARRDVDIRKRYTIPSDNEQRKKKSKISRNGKWFKLTGSKKK